MFKSKVRQALDKAEDPGQTLDYSYQKQLELLQNVKRSLTEVVASKKRLELQCGTVRQQVDTLEDNAKQALAVGREDLAKSALERKQAVSQQLESLQQQVAGLQGEQDKLTQAEQRLVTKVDAFRNQKEVVKAQYTVAQASVKIGEAATGLSEEMTDVGLTVQRVQARTDGMRARASAIDELVSQGTLQDGLQASDPVSAELGRISAQAGVDSDLARLKADLAAGK